MLVSSQLYHLLPDGIPKNHFFRLLGPTSLYTVLISYPDLGTRLFYALIINGKKIEYLSHSVQIHIE